MEHMKDVFPYLWLLNSHTNSLLEPNELTRELLDGAQAFRDLLGALDEEELDYVRSDLSAAHRYLGRDHAAAGPAGREPERHRSAGRRE